MHLLIVRHGQSKNNLIEAAHGAGDAFNKARSVDPPLSELGEHQAALLGKHLGAQLRSSRERVRLVCSSMTRAMQTLMPLARELNIKAEVRPDVHEVCAFYDTSGKIATGPGRKAVEQLWGNLPVDASLIPEVGLGSETCADAQRRAKSVADLFRGWASDINHGEVVVVLVCHGDFINLLARELLLPSAKRYNGAGGTEPETMFEESYWGMNNTAVSHLMLGLRPPAGSYPVQTWLVYHNRSDHLRESKRSGVNFKNAGLMQAAAWARVGEGGSGIEASFVEQEVVAPICVGGLSAYGWAAMAAVGWTAAAALIAVHAIRR